MTKEELDKRIKEIVPTVPQQDAIRVLISECIVSITPTRPDVAEQLELSPEEPSELTVQTDTPEQFGFVLKAVEMITRDNAITEIEAARRVLMGEKPKPIAWKCPHCGVVTHCTHGNPEHIKEFIEQHQCAN